MNLFVEIVVKVVLAQAVQAHSRNAKLFAAVSLVLLLTTPVTKLFAQNLYINLPDELVLKVNRSWGTQLPEEIEFNVYDLSQLEPLFERGLAREEQGDLHDALSFYKQALNISRISNGLYHESQINILDRIVESELAMGNWEAVDDRFAYMELLYNRLYMDDDYNLDIGLRKVVSWHVAAFNKHLDDRRIEHLSAANRLFKMRLGIAERTLAENDPRFDFLRFSIAICERQLFLASDLRKEMYAARQTVYDN